MLTSENLERWLSKAENVVVFIEILSLLQSLLWNSKNITGDFIASYTNFCRNTFYFGLVQIYRKDIQLAIVNSVIGFILKFMIEIIERFTDEEITERHDHIYHHSSHRKPECNSFRKIHSDTFSHNMYSPVKLSEHLHYPGIPLHVPSFRHPEVSSRQCFGTEQFSLSHDLEHWRT